MNLLSNVKLAKEFEEEYSSVENCVVCNSPTEYRFNDHIDHRNYYVEGAGQLCKECYDRTYSNPGTI